MDTSWLGTKYGILREQADAAAQRARAESSLNEMQGRYLGVQTANYGAEAAARIANMRAQTGLTTAQTGLTGEQTQMLPLTTNAGIGLSSAQAEAQRAQAGYWGAMSGEGGFASGTSDVSRPQPKKPITSAKAEKQPLEARAGKGKVPGKGDGKTDTQQAMLAPGEAVLNKAAAEYLGRSTIDVLNHIGKIKMGMDPSGEPTQPQPGQVAAAPPGGAPGFAEGTSELRTWPIPSRPGGGGELIPPGYAFGISDVPPVQAPGQTITNGTWTPPWNDTGTNTGLRSALGLGVPRVVAPPPVANAGAKPLPRFAEGTSDTSDRLLGEAMLRSWTSGPIYRAMNPDPHAGALSAAGSIPTAPVAPGKGSPHYAGGTSKVPGKGAMPPKGKGKAAGLTPGLMAALLGQGMGSQPAMAPGGSPMPGGPVPMLPQR